MLRQQKTEKSSCLYEDKVELESTKGAPNTAKLETGRRNGAEENLLEQFLSRGNLNQAFAKVKAKGGKHGVDGLSIKETLGYLKDWTVKSSLALSIESLAYLSAERKDNMRDFINEILTQFIDCPV